MKAEEENPTLFNEMKKEFEMVWTASDANKDGLLDCDEFKVFMVKNTELQKKRFGESAKGTEKEDEMWYRAYNSLTAGVNGVSMKDFKKGREIIRTVMHKMMNKRAF